MNARHAMRTALTLLGSGLALAACRGEGPAEGPRPLAVTPDHGPVSAPVDVLIRGENFHARVATDFTGSGETGVDARFAALLGPVPLDGVRLRADGSLAATVPPGLATGGYDLTVVDPEGRRGTLAGAYRVLPDGASGSLVDSFRIDPLGPQRAMTPFAVAVTALDAQGQPLSDFNGTVQFTDLTGTAVPGSAGLFAAGRWTGLVEVRAAHAADVLTVSDGLGHSGQSAPFLVAPSPAAGLRFLTPSRSGQAGDCSGAGQPLVVGVFDAFGAPTQAEVDLPLALAAAPAAGFEVFADAACAVPAAPVLAAGASSATFWFRGTRAGTVSLTASAPSLQGDTQSETVVPAPPAAVAFVTTPQTVNAGACSQAVTLEVQDAFGNPSPPGGAALDLAASAGGFTLFADAACSVPATAAAVAPGATRVSFWFSGTTAQAVTVTAGNAALGLGSGSQDEIVLSQGSATQLVILTPPQSVAAGSCSDLVTVQAQDSFGNPVAGAGAEQVTLSAAPAAGMALFSDAACSLAASVIQIGAGRTTASFWFRGTVVTGPAGVAITAGSATLTDAVQTETVTPGPPARLEFASAPMTVAAGACSGLASVSVRDAFGNASPVGAWLPLDLAAAPGTGFTFYADALCATPAAQVTVPGGGSAAAFAFKATNVGTETVTVSAAGLAPASQDETIRAATPDRLVFTSGPQAVVAGACSGAVAVQARDPWDNPAPVPSATAVALSVAPVAGFRFFADAACTAPAASATIPAGQTGATFFFSGTAAGSVTVTASAAGWTPATQAEAIGPAGADHLVFLTAPQTIAAGACSTAATVESRDAFENPAPLAGGAAVDLAAAPSAGLAFYTGAGCAGTPAAAVPIAPGASTATFSFRSTAAGSVTVTASSAPLAPIAQVETVNPAAPDRLVFATVAQTRQAGACSAAATVQSQDPYGNASSVAAATTVSLSASPATGFAFYADAGCSTLAGSVTIAAGTNTASFYFKGTAPGSVTVTASSAPLNPANQTETIDPGAADHLVFTSGAQTRQAGACSAVVTLQSQDAYGNASNVTAATAVTLSAAPFSGFGFYSDPTCSTSVGSVTIPAGSSGASFYFRGTTAGTVTVTAAAAGMSPSPTEVETIRPTDPDQVAFASGPQSVTSGQCSALVTLQTRDAYGNASNITAATLVTLSAVPASGFGFYSDPSCSTSVSSVTIPAGSSSTGFYFSGMAAGSVVVTATPAGLAAASQTETVAALAAPSQLVFLSAPQSIAAGACSARLTVEARDSFGNPRSPAGGATVTLAAAPAAGVQFYSGSDPTCAGAPVTAVSILSGNTTADFFLRSTVAANVTVTASSPSLTPIDQVETINALAPDRLAFTTTPQTRQAGACSATVTVQSQDAYGNPSNVAAAITVSLSASPATGFTFYSDGTCTTVATTRSIASGSNSASVYFKGTAAGSVTVTASSAPLNPATQVETINALAPDRLTFTTTPQTRQAGACSATVTVQSQDAYGNPSNVAAGITASLSASPPTGFTFYSDGACTTVVTTRSIAAGSNSASVYFKGTAAGSVTVTASSAPLNPATQVETINALAPDRLTFTTTPQTRQAGACSATVTVQSQDAYGNPSNVAAGITVSLSASPPTGFTFYSDGTCTTVATTRSIAAGSNSASFYFKGTAAGSVTVTASSAPLNPATQVETINPAPPNHLIFTTTPQTLQAGACSTMVTVQSLDAYGNVSNVGAATTVNLSASPATNFAFYTGGGCTGFPVTSRTIAAGSSTTSFYFRGTLPGSVTVTASAAGMSPSPTQVETIVPAPPDRLAFTTAPQTLTAGTCSAVATVQSRDPYGNVSPVAAATTVNLAASPATGFTFYAGAGCTTPVTSVTIPAGSSSASFSFRGTAAGNVAVTASVTGWFPANQTETVNPAAADHFVWDAIGTPQGATIPFAVTVRAYDAFGNATSSFTGTATLSLSVNPPLSPSPALTCTSGCTAGNTTGAFTAGVWTGSVAVGTPATPTPPGTPDRQLVATSGSIAGASIAFAIETAANPSPPTARFTASPVVIRAGQSVSFDASASSDYETASALLQVSWDFLGQATAAQPPGAAPWSAWSTTKTASNTYASAGTFYPRLAVRDGAGAVGYATVRVVVLAAADPLCVVNTAADVDDGASACACSGTSCGTDQKLSLREALRLAADGTTITFSGPMTISGTGSYTISRLVKIVAPAGVILDTKSLNIDAGTSATPVLVTGLQLTHQTTPVYLRPQRYASLEDIHFNEMAGIMDCGTLTLLRARVGYCATSTPQTTCIRVTNACGGFNPPPPGTLTVRDSTFEGSGISYEGIDVEQCTSGVPGLYAQGNTFTGFTRGAIDVDCGPSTAVHNTFHANGTGMLFSGSGHVLRDNIFTSQTVTAVDCGAPAATFTSRDYHVLYGNASSGCLAADPGTLTSDPRYIFPIALDFRLQLGSPSVDSALDLGLYLLPAFPAAPGPRFLGAGPDRGGRESF
jgi:hypothetical protein